MRLAGRHAAGVSKDVEWTDFGRLGGETRVTHVEHHGIAPLTDVDDSAIDLDAIVLVTANRVAADVDVFHSRRIPEGADPIAEPAEDRVVLQNDVRERTFGECDP